MLDRRKLLKFGTAAIAVAGVSTGMTLLTGCDMSWVTTAIADIPVISGIVGSILSIVALGNPALTPALSASINFGLTAAAAALVTLKTLIDDYKGAKDASVLVKIDAALTDLQGNLSDVLTAAHIKDPALQAVISTGIGLALSVVSAIQLLIPAVAAHSSSVGFAKINRNSAVSLVPQKIRVTEPNTVKMMYNVVAASCGYGVEAVK